MACMSALEKLYQAATTPGDVYDMVREIIGKQDLAIMIAVATVSGTTESISPTRVHEVTGLSKSAAADRIKNTAVKE